MACRLALPGLQADTMMALISRGTTDCEMGFRLNYAYARCMLIRACFRSIGVEHEYAQQSRASLTNTASCQVYTTMSRRKHTIPPDMPGCDEKSEMLMNPNRGKLPAPWKLPSGCHFSQP